MGEFALDSLALDSFAGFFRSYEEAWNAFSIATLSEYMADDLYVVSARGTEPVEVYGKETALQGFQSAYEYLDKARITFRFQPITINATGPDRVLASFWVYLEMADGSISKTAHFYTETFERRDAHWQLIRTYLEHDVPFTLDRP